jgi:hypothetical protein
MTDGVSTKVELRAKADSGRSLASCRWLHRYALLALLGALLLPLAATGCNESMVIPVDASNFRSVVLESRQPVLINFYKDG